MNANGEIKREDCDPRVPVWGIPFAPWTMERTLDEVERLIAAGESRYFMTANLDTAMQASKSPELRAAVHDAAFVLVDGMPIVWGARLRGERLPGRVAGADLFPALCEQSARLGHRVFFLGGPPGVGELAARHLKDRFPGLQVVGVHSPPYHTPTPEEEQQLIQLIAQTKPQLLFVAFGQPKGELWVHRHYQSLPGTVCVQVGAALDFAAGRIARAPRWMQKCGLEWAYRLSREPRRLIGRYTRNSLFVMKMIARDFISPSRRDDKSASTSRPG